MKIVAKVSGENIQLVKTLNERGISAKLVKNGVIVELPKVLGSNPEDLKFSIPQEVKGSQFFIDCYEHGGGMTNTGFGTIVCGLSGKKLKPYYVPKSGNLSNGVHAYFSIPNARSP